MSIKGDSHSPGYIFFVIGWVLVCVGLICNEWALARTFSPDGILESYTRVKIWTIDITLILVGVTFIKYQQFKGITLQFNRLHPKIFDALIGVTFVVIILIGAEWGVYSTLNNHRRQNIKLTWSEALAQDDELLGYKAKPNVQVSAVKKFNGNLVYDAIYSIDEHSRRITPVENLELRPNFILFFGDLTL